MSNIVTNACRPAQMPPTPKNVLMAIADRAGDNGVAWPSIPGLCEATCYGRTAVIDAVKWLESSGMVSVEKSSGRNNRFAIHLDRVAAAPRADRRMAAREPPPVRQADPSGARTGTPDGPVRLANPTRPPAEPPPVRQADPNHQRTTKNHQGERAGRAPRPHKLAMPPEFGVSPAVQAWAAEKGYTRLPDHLDAFKRKVAKGGYTYADWDAAFMEAIREDWAKLRGDGRGGLAPPPLTVEHGKSQEQLRREADEKAHAEKLADPEEQARIAAVRQRAKSAVKAANASTGTASEPDLVGLKRVGALVARVGRRAVA